MSHIIFLYAKCLMKKEILYISDSDMILWYSGGSVGGFSRAKDNRDKMQILFSV
jgi:hypothetical protein